MAVRPTEVEERVAAAREEKRRKKREEYEKTFTDQHENIFTKLCEMNLVAAMGYVLGLVILHLLSHDKTYTSSGVSGDLL